MGVAQKLTRTFSPDMDENQVFCNHSEWQRGFITEATHIELNLALSHFYRVTHVYTVYHWKEWSSELFKPYIRKAMELKLSGILFTQRSNHMMFLASGWPEEVLHPDNPVLEMIQKEEFIARNEQEYGIKLIAKNIRLNPGLRFIAKIFSNSFWGLYILTPFFISSFFRTMVSS